jgi:asparagine synthetase B (glutamine-hydrolysing)
MCGILFTNKDIKGFNIDYILEFLKNRGPDLTSIKHIQSYTFIHTLLSMTGPPTEQPFYNTDQNIICIFNGEIYNFEDFGNFKSDGECLVPLYEKYGVDFINKLDGEFALVLVDLKKNILIYSTDIFGTRPLWVGFDNKEFGISTYKSCLDRIGITNNYQVLANKTTILDLNKLNILREKRVHTFDLSQHKNTFDDWNKAFANSIKKRTKYAKCGIFIGMSSGYDSGAIACELNKQNIYFTAYSIINVEDKNVVNKRSKIIKDCHLIELKRDKFLKARDFLKKNAEEYYLNFDNGEKDKYNQLVKNPNYNRNTENNLLKLIEFRKKGQILTDDNGGIGCSYICSLAKIKEQKIYLSGSGADEVFSDYGFNGTKYFEHSTIGGYFPKDLKSVFPWKNFFGNAQRAYLMKEEHVAGSYGIEGRYPFLDKFVVQEFLWLKSDLKNKEYKSPLNNYLTINNFPYEKNQKTGFGCGFAGPNPNGINFEILSDSQKKAQKNRKVTDICISRKVDFEELILKPTNSFENFYNIDLSNITHEINNCYFAKISINYQGLKYFNKSRFTILENDTPLIYPVTNHSLIRNEGNGMYCFWTSHSLLFSTSDNTDPRTNGRKYTIMKLNNNLRNLLYENTNDFNYKEYYICLSIKNCSFNTPEYFKIRDILNYYNFIPNILECDDYEIFMDLPNIKFEKFGSNNYESRIKIDNILDITIDNIRDQLFDHKLFEDNYTIYKGINPEVTMFIITIGNNQFKYSLESALKQNISCVIKIIKNKLPVDALNLMINRCKTMFYIQIDEDMIFLNSKCAERMVTSFKQVDLNKYWLNYYNLYDINFGVKKNKIVGAIKIFNCLLLKKNNLSYDKNNQFAIDRLFKEKLNNLKLLSLGKEDILGYHQKYIGKNDIIMRLSKISYELINPLKFNVKYEYHLLQKYLTQYGIEELKYNINYILNTLKLNENIFFEKIRKIQVLPVDYNYILDINKDNINNLNKLINLKNFNNVLSSYNIKYNHNFYALVGIINGLLNSYEYNFMNYNLKQFDVFKLN